MEYQVYEFHLLLNNFFPLKPFAIANYRNNQLSDCPLALHKPLFHRWKSNVKELLCFKFLTYNKTGTRSNNVPDIFGAQFKWFIPNKLISYLQITKISSIMQYQSGF